MKSRSPAIASFDFTSYIQSEFQKAWPRTSIVTQPTRFRTDLGSITFRTQEPSSGSRYSVHISSSVMYKLCNSRIKRQAGVLCWIREAKAARGEQIEKHKTHTMRDTQGNLERQSNEKKQDNEKTTAETRT